MPPEAPKLEARFLTAINQIPRQRWNALAGTDFPFLRHEFLAALEDTGATRAESGWQPCHVTLHRGGELVALMPLYLKSHSYGEYVFDWAWADAWQRNGLSYYPKLVTAIPFTPAVGPRICVAAGEDRAAILQAMLAAVQQFAGEHGLSSWHLLFPATDDAETFAHLGLSNRMATQFHWFNRGYGSFDDFLETFNSRKRKSLRRERRRVVEQGVRLRRLEGADIGGDEWGLFHRFYQRTYAKRSGHGGYLGREFFEQVGALLPDHCLMVLADVNGQTVAGSLCFRSGDTLYGRHWGCEMELDCLHFEACYYQGIEHCIERGLARFDPGAQGEHKIQRGFEPVATHSCHWIANPQLAAAVADFTRHERRHIREYMQQATSLLPFKQNPSADPSIPSNLPENPGNDPVGR